MEKQTLEENVQTVINQIADTNAKETAGSGPTQPGDEARDEAAIDLHIYPIVDDKGAFLGYYIPQTPLENTEPEDGATTVESIVTPVATQQSIPQTLPATSLPTLPTREKIFFAISVCLLCFIILFDIGSALYTTFFQTATITLTPLEKSYITTQTIHLVTGLPTTATQLQARELTSISLTQRSTGSATGSYHQDPTFSVGYVTFYNGQFTPATIPAGTQLTGADGTTIITGTTATIPGVDQSQTPPALGQATVYAHAATTGYHGNIQAFDINGPCCATSILVKNTQVFTGGQDERNYTVVRQQDITSLISPLKTTIIQSAKSALLAQASTQETTLLTSCVPTVTPDHHAGDQTQHVTVTATITCGGLAYNNGTLQQNIRRIVNAHAPSTHFQLVSTPVIRLLATTLTPTPTITVSISAVFVYQFTQADKQHLANLLAGKQTTQAQTLLQTYPGLAGISIENGEAKSLPRDPHRIHILVRYLTMQ